MPVSTHGAVISMLIRALPAIHIHAVAVALAVLSNSD
jgi:hypothetical protein